MTGNVFSGSLTPLDGVLAVLRAFFVARDVVSVNPRCVERSSALS